MKTFSEFKVLRYILMLTFIAVFYVGINAYARHTLTVPECALENHHGLGNCPVQTLRWYPHLLHPKISIPQSVTSYARDPRFPRGMRWMSIYP